MMKSWKERLELLLLEKDYKDVMLLSLFYLGIVYFTLMSIMILTLGYYHIFILKILALFTIYFTLKYYQKSSNLKLSALFLIIIIEVEIASHILSGAFFKLPTLYPFLTIAGFFFFFNFKEAIIATCLHYVYWLIIFIYSSKYIYNSDLNIFRFDWLFNTFATSFFILVFSISYYFSTRIIHEKTQKALIFKENILKEIYHRINNNLNFMASILGMQINHAKKNPPKSYTDILKTSRLRIESIAMTHEVLYETHSFKEIEFDKYIQKLTDLISKTYIKPLDVTIQSQNLKLDNSIINKLGIIVNELLTNSIKHSKGDIPKIEISLKQQDEKYSFSYHEKNGKRIDMKKLKNSKTLGMRLIRLTVEDMQGVMRIFWDEGLWVEIDLHR